MERGRKEEKERNRKGEESLKGNLKSRKNERMRDTHWVTPLDRGTNILNRDKS